MREATFFFSAAGVERRRCAPDEFKASSSFSFASSSQQKPIAFLVHYSVLLSLVPPLSPESLADEPWALQKFERGQPERALFLSAIARSADQ
jgi:hypothetical protein